MTSKTPSPPPPVQHVHVNLGDRAYDITIGCNLLDQLSDHISPFLTRPFIAIVTDQNVAEHHLDRALRSLSHAGIRTVHHVLPAGENTKSFVQLETLTNWLLEQGIERQDSIIALGGGVIGDLTGFAAAILRRGCRFIQIPTTLLAQVDSSVGGKTAINTQYGKNLIGAFHQPALVLADISVLSTLPQRELRAGYAEIVKYGLLGDAAFFTWLEANGCDVIAGCPAALAHAVQVSCVNKARIVEQDEREGGKRALLNLGHTFGHALEAITGYGNTLLHGEGVAIGIAMAFAYSKEEGLCKADDLDRVIAHLAQTGLPYHMDQIPHFHTSAAQFIDHMYQDKKVQAGMLTFILIRKIGEAFIAKDVDPEKMRHFVTRQLTACA